MAFLSIIVPVYNKVHYLDSCINSILAQTFSEFELILINDGSTDGSFLKCKEYEANDGRIIVLNQTNQGVSKARNRGIALASGKYIGFIDADDTIECDMFELLIANAMAVDAEISICSLRIMEDENEKKMATITPVTELLSKSDLLTQLLVGKIDWSANNKIYKKEVASKVQFEGKINEDLWYCFNVICRMDGVGIFTNSQKYNYIKRDNSVSLNSYNPKQLEGIIVSSKILNIVSIHHKTHINEAKFLDFVSNLSLLNLVIIANKQHSEEYKLIWNNLKGYKSSIKELIGLSKKQIYAYKVLIYSPKTYVVLLKLYCTLFSTEVGKKIR